MTADLVYRELKLPRKWAPPVLAPQLRWSGAFRGVPSCEFGLAPSLHCNTCTWPSSTLWHAFLDEHCPYRRSKWNCPRHPLSVSEAHEKKSRRKRVNFREWKIGKFEHSNFLKFHLKFWVEYCRWKFCRNGARDVEKSVAREKSGEILDGKPN